MINLVGVIPLYHDYDDYDEYCDIMIRTIIQML